MSRRFRVDSFEFELSDDRPEPIKSWNAFSTHYRIKRDDGEPSTIILPKSVKVTEISPKFSVGQSVWRKSPERGGTRHGIVLAVWEEIGRFHYAVAFWGNERLIMAEHELRDSDA